MTHACMQKAQINPINIIWHFVSLGSITSLLHSFEWNKVTWKSSLCPSLGHSKSFNMTTTNDFSVFMKIYFANRKQLGMRSTDAYRTESYIFQIKTSTYPLRLTIAIKICSPEFSRQIFSKILSKSLMRAHAPTQDLVFVCACRISKLLCKYYDQTKHISGT